MKQKNWTPFFLYTNAYGVVQIMWMLATMHKPQSKEDSNPQLHTEAFVLLRKASI